jgi:hypothetical protein
MRLKDTSSCVKPDGSCHSIEAMLDGCDEPAPEGMWTCDRHAIAAYKRGQELIAAKNARAPHGRDRRGRISR